tara:strand:- start:950 stop:1129 length:180 start_codon:yes stop_codon:yes gene_type:complete
MASKYDPLKRVDKNDPTLGTDGGSPGKQFKMKEEQLTIPGLKLPKAKLEKMRKRGPRPA